jgi:MFS transporter, CP family, cyanate transporter
LFQIFRKAEPCKSGQAKTSPFVAQWLAVMQIRPTNKLPLHMSLAGNSASGPSLGRLLKIMFVLWLAGVAVRMTILAMPPVIPQVHSELHMSETEVGLLIGLPLAIFAIAAVPGSLLIARIGVSVAVLLGMVIAAVAGAARAAAIDVWTLYAAAVATGFGVAIMQPGLPTLVRDWLPSRVALGTIAYTSGMLLGASFPPILTIPYVLPLVGGSWRLDLVVWAVPALLIAPLFFLLSPKGKDPASARTTIGGRWWPDFKNPLIWLLGLTFGSNNSPYFATNAFLGDYLSSEHKSELLGPALGWLNGSQVVALAVLLLMSNRFQGRAWPFLMFGPLMLAAFLVMIFFPSALGIIGSAGLIGFTAAITLTATLALPPLLCAPGDVPRTAAGMFTVSYTCAIVIPTISGALWDVTGKPWTTFIPACLCAVALTVLGFVVTRYPAHIEAAPSR